MKSQSSNKEPASLLLHVCCAPCSIAVMESVAKWNIPTLIYFYNPNIFPLEEYLKRKEENKRVATLFSFSFLDEDELYSNWSLRTKRFASEKERGARCQLCFQGRMHQSAKAAKRLGYESFSTTLSFSRHKDKTQVVRSANLSSRIFGVEFLDVDWRKEGRQPRSELLVREHQVYRQSYCGCAYSKRDQKIN